MGYLEAVVLIERAERSLRGGWSMEAASFLEDALRELVGHEEEQASCYLLLARAQLEAHRADQALESILGAVARWVELLPAECVLVGVSVAMVGVVDDIEVLERLGSALVRAGRHEAAETAFEAMLLVADPMSEAATRAIEACASAARRAGRTGVAAMHLDDAVRRHRDRGDDLAAANALVQLALMRRADGEPAEAVSTLERALRRYGTAEVTRLGRAECLADLGEAQLSTSEWSDALASFDRALGLLGDDVPSTRAACLFGTGVAAFFLGRSLYAWRSITAASALFAALPVRPLTQAGVHLARGAVAAAAARFEDAARDLHAALWMAQQIEDDAVSTRAASLHGLAELAADRGAPDEAVDHLEDALLLHLEQGDDASAVRCLLRIAALCTASGDAVTADLRLDLASRIAAEEDDPELVEAVRGARSDVQVGTSGTAPRVEEVAPARDRYVLLVVDERFVQRLQSG